MSAKQPFSPHYGTNQLLTPAAGALVANLDPNDKNVRLANTGTNPAYIRIYSSTGAAEVATTADYLVPGGLVTTITKAMGQDRMSYISALGTTMQCMTGEGW
jgi:hypothetical protein